MIVELITPLMIATAPMTIQQTEPLKYSHEKQSVEVSTPMILAQYRPTTFGGTQTFDITGRPWDNDND
jgi:hypothetical protein